MPEHARAKPLQRGTDLADDDRSEVADKDAVWTAAKVKKHRPVLRPWHRDFYRRA